MAHEVLYWKAAIKQVLNEWGYVYFSDSPLIMYPEVGVVRSSWYCLLLVGLRVSPILLLLLAHLGVFALQIERKKK